MNKKEFFQELESHLMEDEKPSIYLAHCSENAIFHKEPFLMLERLKTTKQSPKFHPEGSVWNHTMLVLDEAARVKEKSSDVRVFMWAALLHDIGKPDTTKTRKGRITSYNHDIIGGKLAREFLKEFDLNNEIIEKIVALVRWHMQIIYVLKDLPFKDIKTMKEQVSVNDIMLLIHCDRMGRGNADREVELIEINKFHQRIK